MLIEQWPISRPLPYARNARKIPQTAIDKVAASLKEFGWRQPIVVDEEGVIVVGHTRLLAAKRLEMTEVPIHVATGLSPAQVKAYRLMDNRSHDEAKWDPSLIGPELLDIKGFNLDLSLTGFDVHEISDFLTSSNGSNCSTSDASEQGDRTTTVKMTEAQVFWLLKLLESANEPARARASYHALRRKIQQAPLKSK